jgi:hypothetical protein
MFTLNKKTSIALVSSSILALATGQAAQASSFTTTSPLGALGAGFSEVGGIVLDMKGANGARVTSQLSAANMFSGFGSYYSNTLTIGTQTGFTSSLLSALGGGLQEVAVRMTLWDGDTAAGEFDFNDNKLQLNGLDFGNWSNIIAQNTDSSGNVLSGGLSSGGYRNDKLDTGWFHMTDSSVLGSFFSSLSSGQVQYSLWDSDPGDNYLDFKQGVAASMVNVGAAPQINTTATAKVPEPTSVVGLLVMGAGGAASMLKRKRTQEIDS